MQLMPGEAVLAQLAEVTLTSFRVQLEISSWGKKKLTTIGLDDLTSCDLESHSKPIWLALGIPLALIVAFAMDQPMVAAIVGVGCAAVWFLTRNKVMVLRSASEKIEVSRSFATWQELDRFVQLVQSTKAERWAVLTGRKQASDTDVRSISAAEQPAPAVAANAPTMTEQRPKAEIRIGNVWTVTPGFTFRSEAFSSTASPRVAQENQAQRQGGTEAKPTVQDETTKSSAAEVASPDAVPMVDKAEKIVLENVAEGSGSRDDAVPAVPVPPQRRSYSTATLLVGVAVTAVLVVTVVLAFMNYRTRSRPVIAQGEQPVPRDQQEVIARVLNTWIESFRAKNTAAHVDCYAPIVETYFRKHNVMNAQLRNDKEKAFADIAEVRKYNVTDVQISRAEGDRLAATFRKDWDTLASSGKAFAGSEIEKLTFANYADGWKIVREEELKILHVTRTQSSISKTAQ